MSRRKIFILSAALAVAMVLPAAGGGETRWYSFNDGMARAARLNRPVIIDFYASWCHWCGVMDRRTFSDRKISLYLSNHFVPIRINVEKRGSTITWQGRRYTPREFMTLTGARGLPTVIFMDKNGKLITRVPGYIEKEVFFPLLTYIKNECYRKNVPFDRSYITNQSLCR